MYNLTGFLHKKNEYPLLLVTDWSSPSANGTPQTTLSFSSIYDLFKNLNLIVNWDPILLCKCKIEKTATDEK